MCVEDPFSQIQSHLYNAILQLIIRRKLAISLEKFRGYQLIREIHETFPPQTICNIR